MPSSSLPRSADAILPDFKRAMRRLASTVTIVSTQHDGRRYGMAATAVNSVTTEPPTLLVCVNQSASVHAPMLASGRFCINLLGAEHGRLVAAFSGKRAGEDRFAEGDWMADAAGIPCLADAPASLSCVVTMRVPCGSHSVFIGEVDAVRLVGETRPLIYQEGEFFRTVGLHWSGPDRRR